MWEISVFYCSNCGYYAFHQPSDVQVCQKCSNPMTLLNMHYQDFMNLNYSQRDLVIIQHMLQASPTLSAAIAAPRRLYYKRELVGAITQQVLELEQEIHELNETIEWMHSIIWEDFYTKHQLEEEIRQLKDTLKAKDRIIRSIHEKPNRSRQKHRRRK